MKEVGGGLLSDAEVKRVGTTVKRNKRSLVRLFTLPFAGVRGASGRRPTQRDVGRRFSQAAAV